MQQIIPTPPYDYVVLTNEKGETKGTAPKLEAHQKGLLHLAFSVFIFNNHGKMLMQQRAAQKYHFANLWSNACCSHQHLYETALNAAQRRLMQELNIQTPLFEAFTFLYKAEDKITNLTEHELDTVLIGIYNQPDINFNPQEVQAIKWLSLTELYMHLEANPDQYTQWFKIALFEMQTRNLLSMANITQLLKN